MKRLPEQLFFPTVLAAQSNFFPTVEIDLSWKEKYNVLGRFGDRFWLLVGPILGCCFGQGLSSVCVCLPVGVRYNRLMGRLAGRTRPHDSPARPTLPHNVR